MKETDLYPPIKQYLEDQGYQVRAEVNHCDVVATRDDDLIIIELKTSPNLQLLIQGTDRQQMGDSVYVAVPTPKKKRSAQWRGFTRLLRRLELGLITVALDSPMQSIAVEFDPLPYQQRKLKRRKRALIKEVKARSGDYNLGGSTREKLMTAYRENALLVACCLAETGTAMKPAALRARGTGEKTLAILSANHYGWFQRVDRGVYRLTAEGLAALDEYQEVAARCRELLRTAEQ